MSQKKTLPFRQDVNYRKAVIPKPPIAAVCGNCKHFTYDAEDREGPRGLYFEKTNKKCTLNKFSVTSKSVCDKHEFKHQDKRNV